MSKFVEWLLTECSLSVCVCVTLTHVMEPLGPSRKRWALEQDQVLNAGSVPYFTRYKVPDVSEPEMGLLSGQLYSSDQTRL